MTVDGWETVIGLEVHCELATATKLFCGCRNTFGSEPNTNVCPVCLGLPGSLPVLNRQAVELAMRIGTALNCEVRRSIFARKNYFYPDMPKDYQVSQYDLPLNVGGHLDLPDGSRVGIERAHVEEDTGKTTHCHGVQARSRGGTGRIAGASYALVDYNRAGVPLVEIVSAPEIRSPEQAKAYVTELRGILLAIGASDARMEEGSMRVDANVSVRRSGTDQLGTRAEIKNLNSVRSLVRAIAYEARRQADLIEAGGTVVQETRHWDEDAGRTSSLRSKEEAEDYRYFPEPDLVPLDPDDFWKKAVRAAIPPLPVERREALAAAAGVEPGEVALVVETGLDPLVKAALHAGIDPRLALTRATNEVAGRDVDPASVDATAFAATLRLEQDGRLTATQSKQVLARVVTGGDPAAVAAELGFEALATDTLAAAVDEAITANPAEWERYSAGEDKLTGFFVGKVMAATRGKADGKAVTALLRERRGS
ncbi:MAG TPA: Asp-tRNA(Asn)/Glu-tRNA(Gln) amidotransferase subunit GatB [Acidimicrobiales bacterium]